MDTKIGDQSLRQILAFLSPISRSLRLEIVTAVLNQHRNSTLALVLELLGDR